MDWYLKVLKNYSVFEGRARRKEYWFFILFNIIILLMLGVIDEAMGTFDSRYGAGVLGSLYCIAVLIPSLAVAVRRLHDSGRTGWWILINLIPLVGPIVFFVFMVLDSEAGENSYGPNPKEAAS